MIPSQLFYENLGNLTRLEGEDVGGGKVPLRRRNKVFKKKKVGEISSCSKNQRKW